MKKVVVSFMVMAIMAVSGVAMAQDAKKAECDKQKTECTKSKECDKKADCKKASDSKCCKKAEAEKK